MIRLDDLEIPEFASTEEAVAWGGQQRAAHLPQLRAVYKTLEAIALKTNDLPRKMRYALDAQLIREAAESIPNFPHDRSVSTAAQTQPAAQQCQERIEPQSVRDSFPSEAELINAGAAALAASFGAPEPGDDE